MGQAPKGGISMYTLFGWLLLFLAAAYSDGGGAGWLPLACLGLALMICGQRKKLPATRQRRKAASEKTGYTYCTAPASRAQGGK